LAASARIFSICGNVLFAFCTAGQLRPIKTDHA
jgi:hypothetical protein